MKTSKVTSVQGNGTWKELYKFDVELENGDNCTLYKKTDNPYIKPGDEVNYTTNDKGTMKIVREGESANGKAWQPNPERELKIVKQSSLKVAADICIANGSIDLHTIFKTAETIVKWVNGTETKAKPVKETTDLPF